VPWSLTLTATKNAAESFFVSAQNTLDTKLRHA